MTLMAMLTITVSATAMSFEQARRGFVPDR